MKPSAAIIGYGRFGRLFAHYLRKEYSVGFTDIRRTIRIERGIPRLTLLEAALRDLVVLTIPIRKLRNVLSQLAPLISHHSLVIDVCSVKVQPVTWMKTILPKGVSILGTHPLFGPDSVSHGLNGKQIVLCPVRISANKLNDIQRRFRKLGMSTHTMTPKNHDRLMASTLFLTQFVGRSLDPIAPTLSSPATENFRLLRHIVLSSQQDSTQLFNDMYRFNRYAHIIPSRVIKEFSNTRRRLSLQ